MGYLNEYLKSARAKNIKEDCKALMSLPISFEFHKENLFSKCVRIFEWDNLPFNQKELETVLLVNGFAIITKVNDEIIVSAGSIFKPSKFYYDEFTHCIINTPSGSYQRTIGKDAFIISNNSLRNSILPIINRYATMMAHADITLMNALINGRSDVAISVTDASTAESVKKWLEDRYNGKQNYITDDMIESIKFNDLSRATARNYKDLVDTVKFFEEDFFKQFGIKSQSSKRERLNTEEVSEDDGYMTLQIDDMYKSRLEAIDNFQKLFNISVTVHPLVDYTKDNETDKGVVENEG